MSCNHTEVVKRMDCHLAKLATDRYAVTVKFMYKDDLANDGVAHTQILVRMKRGQPVLKFLDFKVNVCDALSVSSFPIPLAKDLFDEARRTSNLPYNCPLKGNFLYYINNYTVTSETIPAYAPLMNFSLIFNIYKNNELVIATETQG
uniref:Uncharacterized protein n=1 Tax=Musca domestica TaxID=7370 RepID=A0A1I8NHM1_MUSDO